MHRFAFVAVLLLAVSTPSGTVRAAELDARITRQLHTNAARYGIAGQAVLIRHNGTLLAQAVAGEADLTTHQPVIPETVFNTYSLAKLLVSALVMQRVEAGRVELDAPASRYLPDLPEAWQVITVRQFLNHASGVPEYFQYREGEVITSQGNRFPATAAEVFKALTGTPLQFTPGTANRYTQTNYLVLTALLEAQYQQPYAQIVQDRVLSPLSMTHTSLGPATDVSHDNAIAYIGKQGALQREDDISWPSYAYGHAALHTTVGDLDRFLLALTRGELVSRATLQQLWQPQLLSNGRRSGFSTGWEFEESGEYRLVGHDGGTRVRARIAFLDDLGGDTYSFLYLTNGSAKNVWSRTLVDSTMAVVAPMQFPGEALSERLITYALEPQTVARTTALNQWLITTGRSGQPMLEQDINRVGYAVAENLGHATAVHIFTLNTTLFPRSPNAWDSLAETYSAMGDTKQAKQLYAKSKALAAAR
ncbi:CubicO group peptidase (beta-lactamase class C family) [Stenotrophomonas rhizophila]|uniref:CubicO group peptidase (Beta-lactamase class C family) n=1 Tax=Stenotrophomonas rhizophila TaxID=216778 RepID=A0A498CF31_9GAMM|nr:serine hydrolase domain-containing protein [Stenotrophomonas rhizophila]RLK56456.1 CubicO group peptidase (beta-lactamase class C family) [Stenotrophomonas rhizophila]